MMSRFSSIGRPSRVLVELRADRHALGLLGLVRIVGFVDQPELERRGRAEHAHAWFGSCTPGSCTTMRFMPWRVTIGSETPSSLTRLRSVVMFCWIGEVLPLLDLCRRHAHLDDRAVRRSASVREQDAAVRRRSAHRARLLRSSRLRSVTRTDVVRRRHCAVRNALVAQLRADVVLHTLARPARPRPARRPRT